MSKIYTLCFEWVPILWWIRSRHQYKTILKKCCMNYHFDIFWLPLWYLLITTLVSSDYHLGIFWLPLWYLLITTLISSDYHLGIFKPFLFQWKDHTVVSFVVEIKGLYCLSLDVYIYIFYNTQRGDSWDYYCYCKWFNFNKMVSMVFSKQSIFIVVVISNKWNTRLFHMTPLISTTKLTTVWDIYVYI
jgi:hypothetical protein